MATQAVENTIIRKLSPVQLDQLCARREALKAELDQIGDELKEQVEVYGFTPPGAEKSKRVMGNEYQVTVSTGSTTEIRDVQVAAIEKSCSLELFAKLFSKRTQYKLQSGASMLLAGTLPAGAPPTLRRMFSAAVVMKAKAPSLTVKRLGEPE